MVMLMAARVVLHVSNTISNVHSNIPGLARSSFGHYGQAMFICQFNTLKHLLRNYKPVIHAFIPGAPKPPLSPDLVPFNGVLRQVIF